MQLRNEMTQERQRAVPARKNHSPQANFQLEGLWLHVLRGTWVAFMLTQLVIIILSLLASRTYGLTICPFPGDCAVTPATAQALHRLGMAPSSYLTYNLVLALFQSPEGGFADHVALAAGLVLGSRKTAQIVKNAATAGARNLRFSEILFMIH